MASKQRLTFEEACKELQVSEDELEQLVANGEIASIKEGDTFFFKREVISQFKKNRKTEPTIILADEDMELLDVMEEIDLDAPKPARAEAREAKPARAMEPKPAETSLSGMDLEGLESAAEEIFIEPRTPTAAAAGKAKGKEGPPSDAPLGAPDDTVLNLDGLLEDDGSEGTTPIPGAQVGAKMLDESGDLTVEGMVSDETLLDTDLLEIGEEEDSFKLDASAEALAEPTEATLLRGGGARAMQMKRKKSHAGTTVMLVVTVLVLLVPLGVSLNTLYVSALESNVPAGTDQKGQPPPFQWVMDLHGFVGGIVEWTADLFGG